MNDNDKSTTADEVIRRMATAISAGRAPSFGDVLGAMFGDDVPASRNNGKRDALRGYAPYAPRAQTQVILGQIAEILEEYEEQLPLTCRQIFYRLVGAHGYPKTEQAYERLLNYLGRARRAEMIRFEHIRDDGIVSMNSRFHGGPEDFWDDAIGRAHEYRRDRQAGQKQYIELWTEASGMLPQLTKVADEFSVPVFSNGGTSSISATRQISRRAIRRDVPTVILHVGDYDPAGQVIFDAMTEDAAAFTIADRTIGTQRIISERIALTWAQIIELDLPTEPAKSNTVSEVWVAREVAAGRSGLTAQAEALAPDLLAGAVHASIEGWFNHDRLAHEIEREAEDRVEILGALPKGSD